MAQQNYTVPQGVSSQSDDLLRIIHNGIDNIIVKLKQAVDEKGEGVVGDIAKTNDAVQKIVEVFNQFQKGLVPGTQPGSNLEQMKEYDGSNLTPNYYGDTTSVVLSDTEILKTNVLKAKRDIPINKKNEANILDLNTNIDYNSYVNGYSPNIEITNDYQDPLLSRLDNCITLERLYLQKHTEIIKIFSFVINLFDKYKYAIKVILFLLKNLVRAEQKQRPPPPPGGNVPGSVSIKLPKPLITNIDLLLKDQKNIQTIINGMEKVVTKTHSSISVDPNIKIEINESLNALDSPPNPPPPSSSV
jgi:hypothetical protein